MTTDYNDFRRSHGVWITTNDDGTFLRHGCWADSPEACSLFAEHKVEFIGWIPGYHENNDSGNIADDMTPAEFAEFIARPDFNTYGRNAA